MTELPPPCSLAAAMQQAQQLGLPRLEAQMLLLHALGRSNGDRAWLISHETDALSATQQTQLQGYWQRRLAGEPIAYITGSKAFYGLDLAITPAVLDPRDDSETLVDWALEVLRQPQNPSRTVLDLGTGSGALALALAAQVPQAQVHAVDASANALAVAQHNGQRLGLTVTWHLGNWLTPLTGLRFDLILSNPPYLAATDPHLPALRHEPLAALVAGADGLDDLRHIVQHAPQHLNRGGHLLLEHGYQQAAAVAQLLAAAGFQDIQHRQDLAGHQRCTGGVWLSD